MCACAVPNVHACCMHAPSCIRGGEQGTAELHTNTHAHKHKHTHTKPARDASARRHARVRERAKAHPPPAGTMSLRPDLAMVARRRRSMKGSELLKEMQLADGSMQDPLGMLSDVTYEQNAANDQWNMSPPPLEWTCAHDNDDEYSIPYLCDLVLTCGSYVYHCHSGVVAAGDRGSIFLGNVITIQQNESAVKLKALQGKSPGSKSDEPEDEEEGDDDLDRYMVPLQLDVSLVVPQRQKAGARKVPVEKPMHYVFDFMYAGTCEFPPQHLAAILMCAGCLRIKSLFVEAKRQMLSLLSSQGKMSSAVAILADAQSLVAADEGSDILHAIISAAKFAVGRGFQSTAGAEGTQQQQQQQQGQQPSSAKKGRRSRRKSALVAMRSREADRSATARVKVQARATPLPPGVPSGDMQAKLALQQQEKASRRQRRTSLGSRALLAQGALDIASASASAASAPAPAPVPNPPLDAGAATTELLAEESASDAGKIVFTVPEGYTPGRRVKLKSRRLSFNLPSNTVPGQVIELVVPEAQVAKPMETAPAPPAVEPLPYQAPPPAEGTPTPSALGPPPGHATEHSTSKSDEGYTLSSNEWYYMDVENEMHGPFERSLMFSWIEHEMLPLDLPVRAAEDAHLGFVEISQLFAGMTPFA